MAILKAVHTIKTDRGDVSLGEVASFDDANVAFLRKVGAVVDPTSDELATYKLAHAPAPVAPAASPTLPRETVKDSAGRTVSDTSIA